MKNFLKILVLIFSVILSTLSITYANEDIDIDWDGINNEIDTEDTYYNVINNDIRKYFLYDFSKLIFSTSDNSDINNIIALSKDNSIVYLKNWERKYISLDNIWRTRVEAFQTNKDYFHISSSEDKKLINEKIIIQYICKQTDIDNSKYHCNSLWSFSEKKFKALSRLDSDNDKILDFDSLGDTLDLEFTQSENIKYVCDTFDIKSESDKYEDGTDIIETIGYWCSEYQLGKFSEIKKSHFIDTDNDGILDYLDNDINTVPNKRNFICNSQDIKNANDRYPNGDEIIETLWYDCNQNQLGSFSQIKYEYYTDTDNDGINDYLDNDNTTSQDNIEYICTSDDILENEFNCTQDQLGSLSDIKLSHYTDSDGDWISDYLDNNNTTNSEDSNFICTVSDVLSWKYGCNESTLGEISSEKKNDKNSFDDLNTLNDSSWFWLEKGQTQSHSDLNLQTWGKKDNGISDNEKLNDIWKKSDIKVSDTGAIWIKNTLVRIAKDLKNLFFFVASIYLLVLVLKVLFTDKTEEASNNLKKWGLRVSIWLIVTQVAYAFIMVLFDKWVSQNLAEEFAQRIFNPFIGLLETAASFFFITIAIYAFYKLVTAHGNEESVKSGKMSIVYAIMWFIIIKLTKALVNSIYGKVNCSESSFTNIIKGSSSWKPQCLEPANLEWFAKVVVDVINWANWFIWIILVVLIIYTWAKILLSGWNEDTLKSSKSSLLYIAIWVWLLVMNYLILTFFLIPESQIG